MGEEHLTRTGGSPEGSAEQASGPWQGANESDPARDVPLVGEPWEPIRLEEVDSTNRYLADLARAGAPHGTVVLAERQTAGRGRLGRRWVDADRDSVLCSILFRLALPIERWHLAGWTVALAAADAAAEVAGVEAMCKWPNDLVVSGRKVAGVLAEVVQPPGALVVGIGINCNWPDGWPRDDDPDAAAITATATALGREAGRQVDRDALAIRLVEVTRERSAELEAGGAASRALASEYRRRCATIGRQVAVELTGERFTGRALDVDDDGQLLVDVGSCVRTVTAGDIVHLR